MPAYFLQDKNGSFEIFIFSILLISNIHSKSAPPNFFFPEINISLITMNFLLFLIPNFKLFFIFIFHFTFSLKNKPRHAKMVRTGDFRCFNYIKK